MAIETQNIKADREIESLSANGICFPAFYSTIILLPIRERAISFEPARHPEFAEGQSQLICNPAHMPDPFFHIQVAAGIVVG